jgi:hypothetical protein
MDIVVPAKKLGVLSLVLLLAGCAIPVQHQVAYDPAALAPYDGRGTGVVTGQGYTVLRDKSIRYASGDDIGLMPVTAYTDEIAAQTFDHGYRFTNGDARMNKYMTFVNAENDGSFTFSHVHPGRYYVYCDLPFQYDDGDSEADDDQWIYAEVTVRNGETTVVKDWVQGH